MTIAVAGNFTEGVVFGAESAITYVESGKVAQVYEGAQKIYHLGSRADCSDSPYGAMIYGAASFEGQSWRNLLANFRRQNPHAQYDAAEKLANALTAYLERVQPDRAKRPDGGLFLAGYGAGDTEVRCFRIDVPSLQLLPVQMESVHFDGMPHVVQRLLFGIDEQTEKHFEKLFEGITLDVQSGSDVQKIPLVTIIVDCIKGGYPKCEPDVDMPLRDAIDYVHFLVYSTVKQFKFGHGAKLCGGDIELAVVTLDRGFRRIRRKPLDAFVPLSGYSDKRGSQGYDV